MPAVVLSVPLRQAGNGVGDGPMVPVGLGVIEGVKLGVAVAPLI